MSNIIASEDFLGVKCTLQCGTGEPIDYWVRFPQGYTENWQTDANQLTATILVAWDDSAAFLASALGYTKKISDTATYFNRVVPLLCPLTDNMYLMSLASQQFGPNGDDTFRPDPAFDNWPAADWIEYAATFGNRPYPVVNQNEFVNAPYSGDELKRYVQRRRRFIPKERQISGTTYHAQPNTGGAKIPIPNVNQFAPFFEFEFQYTWFEVPEANVPWGAIAACASRVNEFVFDVGGIGSPPDGFKAGDLLFKGTSGDLIPYRGPDEEWYYDITYLFGWQPAGGIGNGWNYIPAKNGKWDLISTISGDFPLYFTPNAGSGGTYTADFAGLFRPGN